MRKLHRYEKSQRKQLHNHGLNTKFVNVYYKQFEVIDHFLAFISRAVCAPEPSLC